MQDEILQLARDELKSFNEVLDSILQIPRKTFRKYAGSAYMLEFIERETNGKDHDLALSLIDFGAYEQFNKLCEAAPNIPREAIRAFGLAYTILNVVFFDKRYKINPNDIVAIEMLMVVKTHRGYAVGMVVGTEISDSNAVKAARSMMAKSGAAVRHAENRAMKADVFKWLDDNFSNCKSMDSAAEAMTGKLVPATFRTVRDWVAEWKKLRSASTP